MAIIAEQGRIQGIEEGMQMGIEEERKRSEEKLRQMK